MRARVKVRDRKVAPTTHWGQRHLSLTSACGLRFLASSGETYAVDLIAFMGKAGLRWSSEAHYNAIRRWQVSGWITSRRVRSRDWESGMPGAPVEKLIKITPAGRKKSASFWTMVRDVEKHL